MKPATILVVGDEPIIRWTRSERLSQDGHTVGDADSAHATLEREPVTEALQRTCGNLTKAAALLGLNRDQIRYRIEKVGLAKPATAARGIFRTRREIPRCGYSSNGRAAA